MANTKVTTRVIADDAITSDKLASGLTLGGVTTFSGNIALGDSVRANLGTDSDLALFHTGGNGVIHNATGALRIRANTLNIQDYANEDAMITAISNGAVTIYHNNQPKIATASGGVTITGTATATTFSGALSGTIASATTATTQSASDNTTKVATTAYVTTAVSNLVDSSPSALNTLNELAAALGDDANFSTTVTNSIATKLPLAGGTMTGALIVNAGNNGLDIRVGTDKRVLWAGDIGEIGSVAGFQATNTAGSANADFGIRATTIRLATGSAERVRINDTGIGIGIGSNNPSMPLHVKSSSDSSADSGFALQAASNSNFIAKIAEKSGDSGRFHLYEGGVEKIALYADGTQNVIGAGNTYFSGGSIGLNKSSPDSLLHIDQTSNNQAGGIYLERNGSSYGLSLFVDSDGYGVLGGNGSFTPSIVKLDFNEVRVGIDTQPQYALDVSSTDDITMRIHRPSSGLAATDTCGIGFSQRGDASNSTSDTRAGIFSTYNGNLFLATEAGGNLNSNPADHARLYIAGAGEVGVNTVTPQKTLHVEHTAGASEGILISGSSDTAGHTAGILLRAEGGESDSALRAKGAIFFKRTGTYGVGTMHLANDSGANNNSADLSHTKVTIFGNGIVTNKLDGSTFFRASKTVTFGGSQVTKHVLDINSLIGAGTGGTLRYVVSVVGYASGGANGLNAQYSVGGYSGHNYSATNYGSFGAGTIQNGYKSSNSTSYDAKGLGYHPCINQGSYINNGEVYAYVPSAQQYGFTVSNDSSQGIAAILTVEGVFT